MVETLNLWSYHSAGFSLVEGQVDPEKSEYARDYRWAYERLWAPLGTDQLIWCCTFGCRDDWPGSCEWKLNVPEDRVFAIVDNMVWNGILGNDALPPDPLRRQLRSTAMRHHPGWYDEQVKRLRHPRGCPWDALFLSDASDLRADVILRHPLDRRWIIGKVITESSV